MKTFKRRATLALLLASVAVTSPAFAQDDTAAATEEQDDNGEIVVTAQKREENLQDVPISITALGTQKLDDLNITDFKEYSVMLPSLSFQTLQPGVTTVYMRGVASGGDGNHSGSLPSVGVYLDEQPVTTIGGTLDVHVYDVARIESLAGPQGTLYGASSQAGTIRIITNKPDTTSFYGRVDGELNSVKKGGFGGRLEGMLNIPFNDMMALRIVGFYQRDAGYIDNVPGTRSFLPTPGGISVNNNAFVEKDFNDAEIYGGRAALKIDLDDNWTVTPTVLFQKARYDGVFGSDPRVGDLEVQRFHEDYREDRFVQAALTIEGKIGSWDLTYAGAYLDRTTASSSDYTDYSEAYDDLYSSVGGLAGYFYITNAAGNTIDPRQKVFGSDHFKKMSQELRLNSPVDAPFRVVGGLFYQRQSNRIHQDYYVAGLDPALSVNGFPGTLWLTQQDRVDRDYAAFGEASYDILPNLTLTGGARFYKYDNSLIGFFGFGRNPGVDPGDGRPFTASPFNAVGSSRTGVAGCYLSNGQTIRDAYLAGTPITGLLPAAVPGGPCTNLGTFVNGTVIPKETKDDGFIHRANLTWKATEDVMFYGTWSKGFRPGGINRRGTLPPYAADFLTNYEIGWKTTLADGKVRFNGAIYHQTWSNFQFSFLGENSFTEIHNGPNARINGVETDLYVNAGGGLTFTAAASYTDAKTTQPLCAVDDPTDTCTTPVGNSVVTPKGTRLPITPKFKGNITTRYSFDLGSGKAYFQGVLAHQSSASSDIRAPFAVSIGRLPAFTTANLAVGADFGDFSLEAFVQNLWDERGQLTRFQSCGVCSQRTYILYTTPRTIGVRAGMKF
jgi:iron complex outermembrane receptor protein